MQNFKFTVSQILKMKIFKLLSLRHWFKIVEPISWEGGRWLQVYISTN